MWLVLKKCKSTQTYYFMRIFLLIYVYHPMHRFCFISKRLGFERIYKYWKIRNFQEKVWIYERNAYSYVSSIGLNSNSSKKVEFNEKPHFLMHLKNLQVPVISIASYTISAWTVCTTIGLIRSKKHTKATQRWFSLSLRLFSVFL